ncbi:MAG: VOC family protein [Deinococcaceae bacterium]
MRNAHLRIARPSDNLHALKRFYCEGLGFSILGTFEQHNGFDGLMVGHPDAPYHLEFTCEKGVQVGKAPTRDNLLVFYIPEIEVWEAATARMQRCGFDAVRSHNPYWDTWGQTFEDPDGYRIVLARSQ